MAELKKTPSKIPRFKGSTKQLNKENLGIKASPQRTTRKPTDNPPVTRNAKALPKPPVTHKGRIAPVLTTHARNKGNLHNGHAKNNPLLHDRRGISEIRRSEQNLRLTLDEREQEICALRANLDELESTVTLKDEEVRSMSESLLSVQDRLKTIENENAVQAEKLQKLGMCPVTGASLSCSNGRSPMLGLVRDNSQSITLLFDGLMKIDIPEID